MSSSGKPAYSLISKSLAEFEKNGFALFKSAVTATQIEQIIGLVESARDEKSLAGMRNLLIRSPEIKAMANGGSLYELAKRLLNADPFPVRAILFDKTPDKNWYVTWHQDLTIPVRERVECDGFGSWSVKDGVTHVQPPAAILENMVSLRIHLDPCSEKNGPIKFIARSHLSGILISSAIESWRTEHSAFVATAEIGDIVAMRPLVLHSSSTAESPEHRRVLHLEYASRDLPQKLRWAEA